jgi:hypothetical protein
MRIPVRSALAVVAAVILVGCSGGGSGGSVPSTPATTGPTTSVATPGPTSSTTSPVVPSAAELAGYLVTPTDLGRDWSQWEGFAAWPGGGPGVVPDDQRALLPTLPLCPRAGEDAVALAKGLRWQAFTQLHLSTRDQFATMVVAQQLLLAGTPDQIATTFATLRDGLTRCLTGNPPPGDWEVGLREPLEVPAVGDRRFAEQSSSFESGGARRGSRLVLVQDGPVLLAIQIDEILIRPDAAATLTQDAAEAIIGAMADKLP